MLESKEDFFKECIKGPVCEKKLKIEEKANDCF